MPISTLIQLLANGEFRSGQDLADGLGVSRTAVWKQINKLGEELGLEIDSVRGRGYRIPGGLDLLDESLILASLSPVAQSLLSELRLLESIDSTNSELLRSAEQGAPSGLVCTAEQQLAGRGRRGRQWVSPFASNIYLSIVWNFEQGAAVLEGLSLAVGVAVVRALESCGISGVQLKWPNDVLYDGKKMGGILLEMAGDAAGKCQVVVGIGLNVNMQGRVTQGIDQPWTDLASAGGHTAELTRSRIFAALLNYQLPLLAEFEQGGFAQWQDDWMSMDAFADKPVVLDAGEKKTAGVARGVDARGALQLETTAGVQSIYGGEISVRLAPE